jgi:CheY-like chemotaxis protein/anti-sigma regulatory factor (Ser/Thr protein kinase)
MLGSTLDHLLTAARYDSGNEPIRIEAVELGPVLEQIRRTFEPEAGRKGLELRVRLAAQRVVVTSDATALWRVLMNLVSNAIKFTESEGRTGRGVVVKARVRGAGCRIDVVDTGVGISSEHMEAIWQAYFQVQNAERSRARGLGLGLFLVRRALDQLPTHDLQWRSRPGRGSRFTLTLPGAHLSDPGVVVRQALPVGADALAQLRGAYVLLLEDDREARRAIEDLLDDWGVVHASGATLEELIPEVEAAGRAPDALVTDFRLPGQLSGAACVQELRRLIGETVPAVIVTGESDLASVRAVMPPDTALLQKPFEEAAFALPLLEAVMRARRAESLQIGR